MEVLCVGAYRAGSTWQYNVAASLAEAHRGGRRLGFVQGHEYQSEDPRGCWRVLKAHDGHDAFAAALDEGTAVALYCYRDLRDVAFSLAHLHGLPFETVHGTHRLLHVCLGNDAYWRTRPRGVLVQRYEDLVADPAAAVCQIARHLGIDLADGEDARLAAELSLDASRRRTDEMARRLRDGDEAARRDPHTLLHANHVRNGEVGGWRHEVTPPQLFFLAAACTEWLLANAYETSPDWHLEVIRRRGWGVGELAAGWLAGEREALALACRERQLRLELGDAQGHAAGLEALVAGLHGVIADLEGRLEGMTRQRDEARGRTLGGILRRVLNGRVVPVVRGQAGQAGRDVPAATGQAR